ncbi:hypothetical protein Ae168Ps1_5560 [Pseudonocardia sp. Ae168_Ps1]|nr:hypothetical protein Ae168Ps1_5560 [Pseudonocardia sp. Ae168_Ps1]
MSPPIAVRIVVIRTVRWTAKSVQVGPGLAARRGVRYTLVTEETTAPSYRGNGP